MAKGQKGRPTKEQSLQNMQKEAELALPIPKYLHNSEYFNELDKKDQKRLLEWADDIRNYTSDKLSEVEYYSMATMMFQCELMDSHIKKGEPFDPEMMEELRKAKETCMAKMEKYRDSQRSKKGNSLGDIRKMFAVIETEDGTELEVSVKEKPPLEVIDLDATIVPAGEDPGNQGHDCRELDPVTKADSN